MGKRLIILVGVVAAIVATTVGLALAQTTGGRAHDAQTIHVVLGSGQVQFFDFDQDGLGLGDRFVAVGPILSEDQTQRLGTDYLDCWIAAETFRDGAPLACTYVLKFRDGDITTQGTDPHGLSDAFFSVTGGTGAYVGARGQAEYIDTTQTDVIITLQD